MLKRSGLNKRGPFDIVFDGLIYLFMLLFFIIVAYPILYVLALSFSSREAVLNNEVYIIPVGFNFDNYKLVLKHEFLPKAFLNSVFYTVFGTLYSMIRAFAEKLLRSRFHNVFDSVYYDVRRRHDPLVYAYKKSGSS